MNRKSFVFVALLAIVAGVVPAHAQDSFDAVEIRAEPLAPGVAVLFGSGGNIAVSYGDDATILIDDQFAPLSKKIEAAIAALGASPVGYVVDTHWHYDHTGGNENFGRTGATIFAHENVRIRLAAGGNIGGNAIAPSPPEALPVVTFEQGLKFHRNGDTIRLAYFGGGHTDGDAIVFWEEKNIVHMGDLYFNISGYPFVDLDSGGSVYNAMRSLDLAISMIDDQTKVIPGHGPMSNKAELVAYRAMIGAAVKQVEALKAAGMSLDEAVAAKPLDGFNRGQGFIGPDAFVTAIWNS
ncbi:MAG: MBL fold metallo-hydrolase [Erythrobacter sp.]|nr:MBL fold metallo-hydrolase [Erythrobacter sp.]